MKGKKIILLLFILCSLSAKSQLVKSNVIIPSKYRSDTTSIYSPKYAWNLSRINNMIKWIERNRRGCPDSVFASVLDAKYTELKILSECRLNYAKLDKQINECNKTLDNAWNESFQRNSAYGFIKKEIMSGKRTVTDQLILEGMKFMEEGKQYDGYQNYKKAIEEDPTQLNYYYLVIMSEIELNHDTTKALDYLNKVISLSRDKKITVYNPYSIRAWLYASRKQYIPAIDDLNKVIENDSTNQQELYYRGFLKAEIKDFEGSVSDYQQLLKNIRLRPFCVTTDSAMVLNNIGWSYYLSNDYKLCLEYAGKSLLLNPDEPHALDTKGSGYFGLGDYENCIDYMSKAIALDSDLANSWYLRGLSWIKLNRNELACADISKAAELGLMKAVESMKDLCPVQDNKAVEELRKFPPSKSTNKNRFTINPYGMFYRLN